MVRTKNRTTERGGLDVPSTFTARKKEITAALAVPAGEYQDRSPKGSVDEGIQDLIALINGYDGLVTTSSCAGRVSLFVEGSSSDSNAPPATTGTATAAAPGAGPPPRRSGGLGGRWLFVTHRPDELHQLAACVRGLVTDLNARHEGEEGGALTAGASNGGGGGRPPAQDVATPLVRLQFEPMILHIQAASLAHARPILAAAVTAGWRESGISSLRTFPVVAVRSAGLALGGVVGYVAPGSGHVQLLVDPPYVAFMTDRFRERFESNRRRIARFEENVRHSMAASIVPRPRRPHDGVTTPGPQQAARVKGATTSSKMPDKSSEVPGDVDDEVFDGFQMLELGNS